MKNKFLVYMLFVGLMSGIAQASNNDEAIDDTEITDLTTAIDTRNITQLRTPTPAAFYQAMRSGNISRATSIVKDATLNDSDFTPVMAEEFASHLQAGTFDMSTQSPQEVSSLLQSVNVAMSPTVFSYKRKSMEESRPDTERNDIRKRMKAIVERRR